MFLRMRKNGFTLVELLIVIAIIGVLAMVAVPKFMDMKAQSSYKACRANQLTLETALEQYYSRQTTPAYPTSGNTGQTSMIGDGELKRIVYCPNQTTFTANAYTWNTSGVVQCAIVTGGSDFKTDHNGNY